MRGTGKPDLGSSLHSCLSPIQLCYSVITEGENARQSNKPPIVLIHGFGASVGKKEGGERGIKLQDRQCVMEYHTGRMEGT